MRLGLNILTTFLHSLKPRKLISGSRNTYLPNIFVRHNPHLAARAARLRATKSAGRIRTSAAAPSFTTTTNTDGRNNGTHRRHRRHTRSLRRSTTNASAAAAVFPAQVPSYPQPPGAYACAAPPNIAPNSDTDSAPLLAQKVFFDALYKQRAVLIRAADERREAAEAGERLQRAEEDAEFMRLLAEDQRKAQEAQRRAEEERRLKEEIEARERRRRRKREAEERRRKRAERLERVRLEQERLDQELRAQERLEQERREQERREQERREREQEARRQRVAAEAALAEQVAEWHRFYEKKWAVLRADVQVHPLAFSDIPWPLFGIPASAEDITLERVQEFLCHPQRESVQSAGPAKSLRSEMLRWHPDKFNAKMLNKVVEGEREVVLEAAGKVARFLTQLTAEMQGR